LTAFLRKDNLQNTASRRDGQKDTPPRRIELRISRCAVER
jgi:hypothetical protein